MSSIKDDEDNRVGRVHIGVIGHVDHGKHTLTYAIQKTLEQRRIKGETKEEPNEKPIIIDVKPIDNFDNERHQVFRKRRK